MATITLKVPQSASMTGRLIGMAGAGIASLALADSAVHMVLSRADLHDDKDRQKKISQATFLGYAAVGAVAALGMRSLAAHEARKGGLMLSAALGGAIGVDSAAETALKYGHQTINKEIGVVEAAGDAFDTVKDGAAGAWNGVTGAWDLVFG